MSIYQADAMQTAPLHFYLLDEEVLEVELHEPPYGAAALREAVLQRAWGERRFTNVGLQTWAGLPLDVVHPGTLNTDSGPDFRNAHVRYDGADLHGDVELHITSADWNRHGHQRDPAYDRVLLHVVLTADAATGTLHRADGTRLPEFILGPHLSDQLGPLVVHHHTTAAAPFPCAEAWPTVPDTIITPLLERMGRERLSAKVQAFRGALAAAGDPDVALYYGLMAGLGYAKNTAPMQALAHRLRLDRLRHLADTSALEALLFATAGLLPDTVDQAHAEEAAYIAHLRSHVAQLGAPTPTMRADAWQFFRLRPANFPTLRLAQAAALIGPGGLLHERSLDALTTALWSSSPQRALRRCFDLSLPPFWETHVRLDRPSRQRNRGLGTARIDRLLMDIALPALVATAPPHRSAVTRQRVVAVLRQLPATSDVITRYYAPSLPHALQTQGVHQLYRAHCTQYACLACPVGRHLLGRS